MAATCVIVPLGPACVDLTGVRAGDRNLVTATITSKGAPVNLTGYTVSAQARKKSVDTAALAAVVTVDNAALGQISIRWPGDAVTTLLDGKATWNGVWDLQIDQAGSDPLTVAAGKFSAVMDVTRP
jgi:hypothetical protein